MRKFYFVICSLALASAVVGALRAVIAMVDGNWMATGDAELLWLQWADDIGVKRMMLSIPLAIFVSWIARDFVLIKSFHNWRAAVACCLLAFLPHLMVGATVPSSTQQPTIVLITLDSVRLDYLGWGGSDLPTSPKLDALAAKGVRFTQNISQSSWTKPSTATLLTGLVPGKHHANSRYAPLPNSQRTLAEALLLSGYRTNCFSSNPNITPTFGFKQGFSEMQHDVFANADALITSGKQWLEAGGGQASFLYLHLNDAHYPYDPSADYAGMFNNTGIESTLNGPTEMEFRASEGASFSEIEVESLRLSYAEEIRYLDDLVGDFVNDLLQTRDDVIVIITSDHGEEFLEHGDLGHGHTVHDELIRIPLQFNISESLMQQQQWLPGLHGQQVRQMDVLPTVLEICGVAWPSTAVALDGQSLLPFFGNGSAQSDRSAISETDSQGSALSGFTGPLRAYRLPHAKLIVSDPWSSLPSNRVWLFDLQTDPRETANLAQQKLDGVIDLFDDYKASGWLLPSFSNSSVTITISEEEKLALAALGYGEDSEGAANGLQDSYFDPRAVPWVELELSLD